MQRILYMNAGIHHTEGIKYTGSKLRLLPYIVGEIERTGIRDVLDAFSGTTRVSQALAQSGYDVTANDISEWSEVFGNCYLVSSGQDRFYQEIIDGLNALEGYDGWFSENYGGTGPEGKRPFQMHNARKLDAIRDCIDTLGLEWVDKCVILTSLILALDSVDNTLGHFVSYLSGWSRRSYRDLKLELPARFPIRTRNTVLKGDAFDAVKRHHDLVYLDPPYGSNNEKMPPSRVRYASYYHFWKTVILNDRPRLFGKANRRDDTHDSESGSIFEEFRRGPDGRFIVMSAIDRLISEADADYILLSYSSGGRAGREELADIMSSNGTLLSVREIDYRKNVMSDFSRTREWTNQNDKVHKEYLFLMKK